MRITLKLLLLSIISFTAVTAVAENITNEQIRALNNEYLALQGQQLDDVTTLKSLIIVKFGNSLTLNYTYGLETPMSDWKWNDDINTFMKNRLQLVCTNHDTAKGFLAFDNVNSVQVAFQYIFTDGKGRSFSEVCNNPY